MYNLTFLTTNKINAKINTMKFSPKILIKK